jgi:hypothetical protein
MKQAAHSVIQTLKRSAETDALSDSAELIATKKLLAMMDSKLDRFVVKKRETTAPGFTRGSTPGSSCTSCSSGSSCSSQSAASSVSLFQSDPNYFCLHPPNHQQLASQLSTFYQEEDRDELRQMRRQSVSSDLGSSRW